MAATARCCASRSGRDGCPVDDLDDDAVVARAVDEVGRHIGVDVQPAAVRVSRWPGSFPQYRPHHQDWLAAVDAALPAGLFVSGASYDGIGIPACIAQAPRHRRAWPPTSGSARPDGATAPDSSAQTLADWSDGTVGRRAGGSGRPRWLRRRRRARPAGCTAADHHATAATHDRRRPRPRRSTSTTTTSTTLAPTSTLPLLPVPVPPPPEDGSTEPRIEVGTIEIPKLGLTRPMFEGIRLATLDNGPGHWPGTALPGEVGNVVVAGHRVSHNQEFRNIDQLLPGDEVIMSTLSGRHVYRVRSTEVVAPEAIWIVDQTYARTATLFACHPPGSVRERIVVHLEL